MRNLLRNASILGSILLAVLAPFIASGYSELKKAVTRHPTSRRRSIISPRRAASPGGRICTNSPVTTIITPRNMRWRRRVYQKAHQRGALSPEGWVAWGDVVYLGGDTKAERNYGKGGLEEPNPSENLYSRLAELYRQDGEYSKAAEYLQRYVEIHTEDASARYRLGLLLTLSDPDEACRSL
jgi:tetratricopeptide (TPR) repeat protein